MNVVFLRSNSVNPDSRVEKEVNTLVKNGHKVTIVAWDREESYKKDKIGKLYLPDGVVDIYRFGIKATFGGGMKKNLLGLFKFQLALLKWLFKNKKKYEVIHACDFDTAFVAHKVAKILRKKIIYDIFDYYTDAFSVPIIFKRIITKLDHNIINSANAVIICTEQRIEQLKGTSPNKLEIIHNTPSDTQMHSLVKNNNKTEEKVKLVYVGILTKHRLIKEITEFVKSQQLVELHIGGFGEYENYLKSSSEEFCNIHYYGKLTYQQTLELENKCDIMTAIYDPSVANHRYAAPNKFYEALMLGKPLIVAKNTAIDEIVKEHDYGQVIEYNIDSFKKAIEIIYKDRNQWADKSLAMREMYKKKYDWALMEDRILSLYDSI